MKRLFSTISSSFFEILLASLLLSSFAVHAMQENHNDSSNSGDSSINTQDEDNDRTVDLKVTWEILAPQSNGRQSYFPIAATDPNLIASYYAIFKNCNNSTSDLTPETTAYIKNPSNSGYLFTPTIRHVFLQKDHSHDFVILSYTIEKDGTKFQKEELKVDKFFWHTSDPSNNNHSLRMCLLQAKDDHSNL